MIVVDLGKLGFQKLLGDGRATKKYRITAKFASGIAIDKIKQAGGEVIVTIKKKEKKPKTEQNKKKKAEPEQEIKPESKKAKKADASSKTDDEPEE